MQSEDEGDDLFISRDEVTEVKQFLGGRIDRLKKIFKAPDVVALTWFTHLSKWSLERCVSSGAVPLGWENRVVFPNFSKGDQYVYSS